MKHFLTYLIIISTLLVTKLLAQEVEVNLGGNTTAHGFSVVNSDSDTLFRILGDGSAGFNTATPVGIFDILGGTISSGIAKDINIIGQGTSVEYNNGGSINIESGFSGHPFGTSGDVNIKSGGGGGEMYSGDINLTTSRSEFSGDINIKPGGGVGGGSINIETSEGVYAGGINIITGGGEQGGGSINILTGYSDGGGGHNITIGTAGGSKGIELKTGGYFEPGLSNSLSLKAGAGADIIVTPGGIGLDGDDRERIGMFILNGSGTYSGTWTQVSDKRFKKNIQPITKAVDKIKLLQGLRYNWKIDEFPEKHFEEETQIGMIAQEVESILPELVRTDSDGYKSIDYSKISVILVQAMKEQQIEIERQSDEINKMKSAIEELRYMISQESNKFSSNEIE